MLKLHNGKQVCNTLSVVLDDNLRALIFWQLVTVISPKTNKKTPAPHQNGDSLAYELLPKFEQAIFDSKLRPTMCQLFGSLSLPAPWDVDHGHQRIFMTKLQEYHNLAVDPENQYEITASHLVSKKVCGHVCKHFAEYHP